MPQSLHDAYQGPRISKERPYIEFQLSFGFGENEPIFDNIPDRVQIYLDQNNHPESASVFEGKMNQGQVTFAETPKEKFNLKDQKISANFFATRFDIIGDKKSHPAKWMFDHKRNLFALSFKDLNAKYLAEKYIYDPQTNQPRDPDHLITLYVKNVPTGSGMAVDINGDKIPDLVAVEKSPGQEHGKGTIRLFQSNPLTITPPFNLKEF